jgi:hypothetical protein
MKVISSDQYLSEIKIKYYILDPRVKPEDDKIFSKGGINDKDKKKTVHK